MNRTTMLFTAGLLLLSASALTAASPKTYQAGTLHVEQYGDHGRPLILIPGLGSGAWVWKDTIAHFKHDHVIYALTLAGFNGTTPPEQDDHLMGQAASSLSKLIEQRRIDKPVLVGHSLGGTLAIRFAEEHSDTISGVIAADGLPVFPPTADMTDEQRRAMADRVRARMSGATPKQFRAHQLRYMRQVGVMDADDAKKYAKLQAQSDPQATAEYMAEDVAADYRPGLGRIDVPLLEIAPYNDADAARDAAARGLSGDFTRDDKLDAYRKLLKGAPHVRVIAIAPSRHFVMLDQPKQFREAVASFLDTL